VSVAAIMVVAVNTDGQREVLGLKVGASEAELLKSLRLSGMRTYIMHWDTTVEVVVTG
jgi:putative transposase